MFFIRIGGGLGNQMFQYAFAKAYSIKNNCQLFLDTTAFNENVEIHATNRKFKLNNFNITLPETIETPFWAKLYSNRYLRKIHDIIFSRYILKDHEAGFNQDYFQKFSSKVFDGYFQSPKYFEQFRKELLNDFRLRLIQNNKLTELINRVSEVESIAIHIRRGDYLLAKNSSIHGVLNLEYYKEAIKLFEAKIPNANFYIFSDDINWCKETWKSKNNFHFIEPDLKLLDIEEMKLMSACKHQIIANSSFSWWAAWLNENEKKNVVAPKNWFADIEKMKNWDIYPEDWIKI